MENWRPIQGYEGLYEVSDYGRVKSLENSVGKRLRKEFILSTSYSSSGNLTVALFKNGKRKAKNVHNLVADTFILNTDNKKYISHIDGEKANNHVSNLRRVAKWSEIQENIPTVPVEGDVADKLLNMYDEYIPLPKICKKLRIARSDAIAYLKQWMIL